MYVFPIMAVRVEGCRMTIKKGTRTCQVGASVNGRSRVNVVKANKVTESCVMVPGVDVTVSGAVFTD